MLPIWIIISKKAERSQFADLRPMQNILSSTGEKGIVNADYTTHFTQDGEVKLVRIQGGTAYNIVPALCEAEFAAPSEEAKALVSRFNGKDGMTVELTEGGFKVTTHGKEAHGSHPELGENAIGKLLLGIKEFPLSKGLQEAVTFLADKIGWILMVKRLALVWKMKCRANCPSTWVSWKEMPIT